eukprot:Colp12_sorted_trinity150504_noHs@5291
MDPFDMSISNPDLSTFAMPGVDTDEATPRDSIDSASLHSDNNTDSISGTPRHWYNAGKPVSDSLKRGRKEFVEFMMKPSCYDIIPLSGKIVVFDTALLVKKAFFALTQNGIRSAPLWSSQEQAFVGMLTISDFINILRQYYKSPLVTMHELEEHKIQTWREIAPSKNRKALISVSPMASLYEAATILVRERIHRLPIIDEETGSVVAVLTHKRILNFLHANCKANPPFFSQSIFDLGIGTYDSIITVTPATPIIVAINLFAERRVSALPVVDDNGVVIDIYAKYDVINLARERSYNDLDKSVHEALIHRQEGFEGVQTCQRTDSLRKIFTQIVKAKVHRLVVVDPSGKVDGIVSLSDILSFLLGIAPA